MRFVPLAIVVLLAGCAGGAVNGTPPQSSLQENSATRALPGSTGSGKIMHVVYIVQEGRSFDDLFQGYPGADSSSKGYTSTGKMIKLAPISLKAEYNIDTAARTMFLACNGAGSIPGTDCRMDGFNNEEFNGGPKGIDFPMYAYVPHSESKPYFEMAREWVVADRMFASQLDGSFAAHQYIVAAQSGRAVGLPDGGAACLSPPPGDMIQTLTKRRRYGSLESACFTYSTLANELEAAKLSWRFYTPDKAMSSFAYDEKVFGTRQWRKDVITPPSDFLTDIGNGKLANVTWITPQCPDSDAVNCGGGDGPAWVASVVNAVGKSKFWDSTAIFVQWDDWGGFYDHVPPKFLDFDGAGFRVPLLAISAYAKRHYVSHVQYETASVLKFTEDLFGLAPLAAADARATSPGTDCFDFSRPPRKFVPIKT